nr:hypothetical protein [Tanacetum cinerariifolium]
RPDSPLHLSNEEPVLGYLKFSAKGTKSEVFRMPIPDSLITAEIQQATYYREYLAKATETINKPAKPKRIKHGISRKTRQPRSSPKSVGVSEAEEVLEVEPQVADEDADYQKALEESMKDAYALPKDPLPPVVIREPESEKYQPLPEVPGKGKAKVTEEQSDNEEESGKVVLGAEEGGQDEGQAGPDPDAQAEDQTGSDADREHMDLDVVDVSPQPSKEQLHEGFTATVYSNVQENLKLVVEEPVLLEEPASSSGTLSSLQHLSRDFSFGDQFFSDKQSDADKNAKTKVESMVSIAVSEVVTDAVDWAMQAPLRNRFRDLPKADMKDILHQRMWESDSYKSHEDHMQLFEALKKSMNRDHSEEQSQDLAEAHKKKKKSRKSLKMPPGSPSHQPPTPPPPSGPSGASGALRASGSAKMPPSPPPPSSTNQESPSKRSAALNLEMDEDMALDEQAQSSDDEDIRSAHIPTMNLRQGWWKPFEEERPTTPEPPWSIRSSDVPVPMNTGEGRRLVQRVHVRDSGAFENTEDLSQPGELRWRTRDSLLQPRSPKSKRTIKSRAKRSSQIISLGHDSTLLASSHTVKNGNPARANIKQALANELTDAFGKPFEVLNNVFEHRKHRFHPRPDSPLHLSNEEPVLGYLKCSAKGTKSEVFRMPIPNSLITAEIQHATYYREYLAKATETTDKPAKPKRIKHGVSRKTRQPRSSPKSVGVSEAEEVPEVEPQVTDKDADYQKALEESMKYAYALPKGPLPPVVIREPESGKYQPLPEVLGKGKAKVTEEQSDNEEESKKVVLGAEEGGQDEGQAGPDPDAQAEDQTGSDAGAQAEGRAGSNPDETSEGQAGSNPDETSKGQAGSDPGDIEAKVQSILSPVVHVGSDREHTDLDVADVSPQPSTEQLDEGFTATVYSNVQENLKLAVKELVLLEEPASSSGTLSSLQHLSRDFSFGDQFFSDKHSDADKNEETEVESMVNVTIQQALSSISLMTLPIIDLTSRPESPKEHHQLKTTTTDTTTTTLPPPQAPQQSTTEAMMVKRIDELEHILADLIQVNKNMEERLDKHGARLYTLEQLDISQQVSIAVSEVVTDAVDWAMQAPIRSHFRDLPEADMKEILHQRMWESDSYKSHEDHMQLFEALEKASGSAKMPPSPPPPSSTNQESPSKGSAAPSPSKTAASAEYQAWTTTDIRLMPSISLTSADLEMDEDMALDEQAQSSNDEDIRSAHIPTVNLRQGWWKPFEEERPTTPEPAWSIRSSDVPVLTNNWASALASNYSPPPEDSLLTQTGDIATFIDWFCKRRGITELKPQDLEGPAYEIIKVFHQDVIHLQYQMEECHKLLTDSVDDPILRHNVSKPLPPGGPPGQVTIQSDFFFNKDLEYLRYDIKGRRPVLSISKMKAVYYPDAGLEKMVPN